MKKTLIIFICLNILAGYCYSQTAMQSAKQKKIDSVKAVYLDNAAISYPLFRQASLSTEVIGNANTTGDLFGSPLYKGKVNLTREKANFNIPFIEWGKNNLVGSVSYLNQHYNVTQVQDYNPQVPVRDMNFNTQTIGLSLSYTRHDSLFNEPVIYNGTIASFTNQLSSVQKVSYLGALIFPIKHADNDAFKIGVVVIIDPSSFFPVLPYFSYWHKFEGSNTELFIDLPSRVALRKQLTPNSWLALSIEQTSTFSFFNINEPPLPQDAQNTLIELKTGPSYEYRVAKKVILGVYGGAFSTIDSRLSKRNADWKDYYVRNHTKAAPYLNFTVSFLPFMKPLNK
jgi:hypothetical protein